MLSNPSHPKKFSRRDHVLRQTCLSFLLLAGCSQALESSQAPPANLISVTHQTQVLAAPARPCTQSFATHPLDYQTNIQGEPDLYLSNGSGVAINDLNQDGWLDLVFANLDGPNTILWNQGDLTFRKQELLFGDSLAVNVIDLDGDGWQDILFTRRVNSLLYLHNTGQAAQGRKFKDSRIPSVTDTGYAMNWTDLGGDGDLDLVIASYVTELKKVVEHQVFGYMDDRGVYVYDHQGDTFNPKRLAEKSSALAIAFLDFNQDHQLDILVGNDFNVPDYAWQWTTDGWTAVSPFARTTENTMSFDLGDINNDGSQELFAADMKPYHNDVKTWAAWLPMMNSMVHPKSREDPQYPENVLQVRGADGRFHNEGYQRFVDATGWSWSSKFGDLDNDGFLDLYSVNGMIAKSLFGHLPSNELVEENQALRNRGNGYFEPAPQWGLGSKASGRGMSLADLDNDGDLDSVVNNLESPAQLFENQLCGGESLEVDLVWSGTQNLNAIGAQLALHTSTGSYYRDVRAASGYLSGDPARVHFGFPKTSALQRLDIFWPDGRASSVDLLAPHTLLMITR